MTDEDTRVTISPIIRALDWRRRELRLSQTELARRANTQQSHISDILAGRVNPSLGVLERLCAVLGLHLTLAYGVEEQS